MTTTVMVVDDSNVVRKLVGSALSSAGFDVIEAEDGVNALELLSSDAAPSLIVLDMNMPRMGGLELLQKMKDQSMASVPVVMLTTEGQPRLMQQAKALGAKGWIVKPFKADMLVAAVRKLTHAV